MINIMYPEEYRQTLIRELHCQNNAPHATKDILIVVRNQHEFVRQCLESVSESTEDYRLFIWDNASDILTQKLIKHYDPHVYARSEQNIGFIRPNNHLAALSSSPYIILLNSDVTVKAGWADAMTGFLAENPGHAAVGYEGGVLNNQAYGTRSAWGDKVDYVVGWCMCVPSAVYRQIGLFDSNLKFAYGEDADFGLRATSMGYKLYALHLNYATHVGGVTIKKIKEEKDVVNTFNYNHAYLRKKWWQYLEQHRVALK